MPIAVPDNNKSSSSFFIDLKSVFCFVTIKYTKINTAARIALYKASSPELMAIFLVNIPKVPKITIEIINMILAFIWIFIFFTTPIPANSLILDIYQSGFQNPDPRFLLPV